MKTLKASSHNDQKLPALSKPPLSREMIEETVVLSTFQRNLAANFSWARVHPETLTYWRKVANIKPNAQKTTRINAELLIVCLMFRPRVHGKFASEQEKLMALRRKLSGLYRAKSDEIKRNFVLGMTADSVKIDRPVLADDLADALVQAGGFYRSAKTLKRYAAILSERLGKEVVFPRERAYEPELATAFARLSLEMWSNQRQAAFDRQAS